MTKKSIPDTQVRIRYTKAEAAEQLSISVRHLDELRQAGLINARIDGSRVYFDHSELVSYAKSRPIVRGDA